MKDILDHEKKEVVKQNSRTSFRCFFISLMAMFIINSSPFLKEKLKLSYTIFDLINAVCGLLLLVTLYLGVSTAIKSIIEKDRNDYKKIIGIIGNGILLILFINGIYLIVNGYRPS